MITVTKIDLGNVSLMRWYSNTRMIEDVYGIFKAIYLLKRRSAHAEAMKQGKTLNVKLGVAALEKILDKKNLISSDER